MPEEATAPLELVLARWKEQSRAELTSGKDQDRRVVAARILGLLKDKASIELLLNNLTMTQRWTVSGGTKDNGLVATHPALGALLEIGGTEVLHKARRMRERDGDKAANALLLDYLLKELVIRDKPAD